MLRCIVFDFNGVLVDDEAIHEELLARVLRERGIEFDHEEYLREYLGKDDRACYGRAFELRGRSVTDDEIALLAREKTSLYLARAGEMRLFGGARELVEEASAAGLKLAIASGAGPEEIEAVLASCGLLRAFAAVVSTIGTGLGKPHPFAYAESARRLGVDVSACVAVEDSSAGVDSAHAAGIKCAAVCHTLPAERLSSADLVRPSLARLSLDDLRALVA